MKGFLLAAAIGVSIASASPSASSAQTVDCTPTATGPTYWFDGRLYFHFDTTCTSTQSKITIHATIVTPTGTAIDQTKTCTNATTCSYVVGEPYARGTWTWTNDSTWSTGSSSAENTVTEVQ